MTSNTSTHNTVHTPSPPPCIILLNGFPGVGKLTIARKLEAKLKELRIPNRLLDNYLLIDPIVAIHPFRDHQHYVLRKAFRKLAFEGLKSVKEDKLVILCTAALSTSECSTPYDDIAQLMQHVEMGQSRGVPLVVVSLECDMTTNSKRLCHGGRIIGGKTKLTDVKILRKIRRDTSLLTREQIMDCGGKGSTFSLELDTSTLSVGNATEHIWNFLLNDVSMPMS